MDNNRLEILLGKQLEGRLTGAEGIEMDNLMLKPGAKEFLSIILQNRMAMSSDQVSEDNPEWKIRVNSILFADKSVQSPVIRHRIHFLKTAWFRYAAAILILFATGIAVVLSLTNRQPHKETVQQPANQLDVQPGGNKAILTLSDGSTIVLDSAAIGTVANQGNTRILKLNAGALSYNNNRAAALTKPEEILYNIISTPRGGQYQVVLSDGSRIWLNAASSIRFPSVFTGAQRMVEITGEAYLEIAQDAGKPFHVNANGIEIQVLGTSFNVNAYTDEETVRTTLVSGSVRVANKRNSAENNQYTKLNPGQQNSIGNGHNVVSQANISEQTAWKNGYFEFNETPISSVMRQLARWYDLEVIFEGNVNGSLIGTILRTEPLAKVFEILQQTKVVRFKINGKKVIVTEA